MELNQDLSIIVTGGKAYHIIPGEADGFGHCFGGPALHIDSEDENARLSLQALFHLNMDDSRLNSCNVASSQLHLYYGFKFDNCETQYRLNESDELDLVGMTPNEPTPDWPYSNYPLDFPVVPVRLEPAEFGSMRSLSESYAYFAKLQNCGGGFYPKKSTYVVVTPSEDLGVSLWGEDGDAAFVTVGYCIDSKTGIIKGEQGF